MMSKYTDYNFQPFLQDAIANLGFTEPTPIQKEIIPLLLKGKSAIGQSHTGTGKTHSFLIPIVQRIDVEKQEVQAVITSPTRELAQQIFDALNQLIEGTAIQAKLFIGGTDKQRSIDKLKHSHKLLLEHQDVFVTLFQHKRYLCIQHQF